MSAERVILKILNGVQTGAEVSLTPGEYTIGTGSADDIQLVDVSLKEAHAKLRVDPSKLEISGGAGTVTIGDLRLAAGSEWQEIEPLDVITLGMVRLVLGPPNANWTTLTEDGARVPEKTAIRSKAIPVFGKSAITLLPGSAFIQPAILVVLLAILVLAGVWFFSAGGGGKGAPQYAAAEVEAIARKTIDQFPFGRALATKMEADGTVYVTGYVKDSIERRAVVSAVEKAGVSVYFRLGVLDAMRNEIDGLINSQKVAITFTLSDAGDLTLEGLIFDDRAAKRFVEQIRGAVAGLNSIDARIRTSKFLLEEVQKLSRLAHIDPFVLLRLDGQLIEANGILPTDKIDTWVGFLQSYSKRFSKEIGLRSFVQLQKPDGALTAKANPVVINGPSTGNETVLDAERIMKGQYETSQMFAGPAAASNAPPPGFSITRQTVTAPAAPAGQTPAAAPKVLQENIAASNAPPPGFSIMQLATRANELIQAWKRTTGSSREKSVLNAVSKGRSEVSGERIPAGSKAEVSEKLLPLLPTDYPSERERANACRPGSRLMPENIPLALFWLDLLSVSEDMSLSNFEAQEQAFILEAALDPSFTKKCLLRAHQNSVAPSIYLSEAARNPDFVRFVTRKMQSYPLDISGASTAGPLRYVQTREGAKIREGSSPDKDSRLIVVGELGAAVQGRDGYSTVLYKPTLNWLNQR